MHPVRGPAVEAVYAAGTVEAIDAARVGGTVAGRVAAVAVREGDAVRRGRTLAQLDDRRTRQRLEDARARLLLTEQNSSAPESWPPRESTPCKPCSKPRRSATAGVALAAQQLDGNPTKSGLFPRSTGW